MKEHPVREDLCDLEHNARRGSEIRRSVHNAIDYIDSLTGRIDQLEDTLSTLLIHASRFDVDVTHWGENEVGQIAAGAWMVRELSAACAKASKVLED